MDVWLEIVEANCKVRVATEQDAQNLRDQIAKRGGRFTRLVQETSEWVFYMKRPDEPKIVQGMLASLPGVRLQNRPA